MVLLDCVPHHPVIYPLIGEALLPFELCREQLSESRKLSVGLEPVGLSILIVE